MRAVAAVVQLVAAKERVVRDVHVDRVAHEADVVADDARALRVVELDAVATPGRVEVALAGDQVVLDQHVVGLLDPQPEQRVREVAVAHHRLVRAGVDVDAGVLVQGVAARVGDDQALDGDVLGLHADGVFLQLAVDRRALDAAQGQRLVDHQVAEIARALDFDHVARRCAVDDGLDGFAGLHTPRRRACRRRQSRSQRECGGQSAERVYEGHRFGRSGGQAGVCGGMPQHDLI